MESLVAFHSADPLLLQDPSRVLEDRGSKDATLAWKWLE